MCCFLIKYTDANGTNTLQQENDFLKEKITSLEEQIDYYKTAFLQLHKKQFAASSEKASADQLGLFNEAEAIDAEQDEESAVDDSITAQSHTRQNKPRVSIPADYPREDIIYDIEESEKVCPHDGTPLICIGSEEHEQLEIIPAQVKVVRHQRLKYTCPCCEQHMISAQKPKQPIEKSIASPGLLAFVATQKYCDALPLYRQSEMFKRIGVALDRTNLANWMVKCGELIQPLINLLHEQLLERPLLHMDETTLQVLNEPNKTAQSNSYLWLMASFTDKPITVFHYAASRSQQVAKYLLQTTMSQALMVDGYKGYQPTCDDYQIKRLGCWAHARRYFMKAKNIQPKGKAGKADQALS